MPAHKKHTVHFRSQFLKTEGNKSVTDICREFNISRKTYYKWKNTFEKEGHTENKDRGRKKSVDQRIEKIVRDLVILYPEWNLDKLYNYLKESNGGTQLVSRYWIQTFLQKEQLSNKTERFKYSHIHSPQPLPTESQYLNNTATDFVPDKQITLAQSDPSPPSTSAFLNAINEYQNTSKIFNHPILSTLLHESLNHSKAIIFTIVVAILNSYLISRVVSTIISAEGISQKIGMALSSMALFCGAFFFLYSLKYYITIISVVLKAKNNRSEGVSLPENILAKFTSHFKQNNNGVDTDPISLHKEVQSTELEGYPFFSVQVALYNEKRVAERVVRAALAMEYPNFEIVVCDDSTDETTEILKEKFGDNPKVKIVHRTNRSGFKGAALGNALNYMDPCTDYVVVFDADFVPYPDTLTLFAKYYQVIGKLENSARNEVENTISKLGATANQVSTSDNNNITEVLPSQIASNNFVGKTVAIQGYQWHVLNKSENWITRAVRAEFAGSYIIERSGGQVFGLLKQIAGSVYSINATVLKEVGWGTSITEDFQLTLKLYEKGYKVGYTPYIQAPSECVSTLKRLIRQRQRWAEGHSFNIKKHIAALLTSDKLTGREKWEAIYLTPYYLQAFVFIIGTLAWIVAETILQVRLPFWSAALGWSLVLTNLFSLPLMNTIGLFLEEGEERDYLGIFSFVTLCYILAPFIGFAALKGFIEKDEGPWFRTPKSGHITDNVKRGVLNTNKEKITKLLPWLSPAVSKIIGLIPQQDSVSPYLAYTTAANSFNSNTSISQRNRIKKRLTHLLVVVLFAATVATNVLQTSIPQAFANPDTYYARATADSLGADNMTTTSTALRTALSTSAGSSTQTFTINSTNTTFYVLSDNMNKRWTNDTKINDSNSTGERRNVSIATESDGDTVAVWEDSRNTSSQNIFAASQGNLVRGRNFYAANNLFDGRVLFSGGFVDSSAATESSAEIYDPVTSTFSLLSVGMTVRRNAHAAVTLDDGRVLIIGGRIDTTEHSGSEIFDPYATSFAASGNMATPRLRFPAVKLNNGKVLAVGGCSAVDGSGTCTAYVSTAELFDPGTATWTSAGSISSSRHHLRATLLPNGEVLTVGGYDGSNAVSTAEIYNPVTNTWRKTSPMSTVRVGAAMTSLADNTVLVAGGTDGSNGLSTSELYDPASGTWSSVENTHSNTAGFVVPNALVRLGNGKVLFTNGNGVSGGTSTAEIYDPITKTWSLTTNNMVTRRNSSQPILLRNGKVLIAGGFSGTEQSSLAELYTPITFDIYAQKYDKTGAKQWNSGTDIRVNTDDGNRVSSSGPPNYNHLNPSVSLDASGNAIVVWEEQRDGVFNSSIWTQKLAASDGAKQWPNGTKNSFASATGAITYARDASDKTGAIATTLNNGKIMITGTNSSNIGRSMAEIYDPVAGTYAVGPQLVRRRQNHSATVMLNGQVLIAGSEVSAADASNAEIYDPIRNTFSQTGFMPIRKARHAAVLLNNGKVFLVGGTLPTSTSGTTTSEIFDPSTGTWAAGPNMTVGRNNPAAVTLPNGKVLVVGDSDNGSGTSAADLFDPVTNTFTKVPGSHQKRGWNSLILLNNGKVLSVGAYDSTASSSELYDPVANTWSITSNMVLNKQNAHLFMLPDGRVIAPGGWDNPGGIGTTVSELFDPSANTWSATTNSFKDVRIYAYGAYMPSNNKLIFVNGAATASTSAEVFTPKADMPVSQYDYKYQEGFNRTYLGAINGLFDKKPKVVIDGNGDAVVVWQENKNSRTELQGSSHNFDANARQKFGVNTGPSGNCGVGYSIGMCGQTSTMLSPPINIVSQKVCNSASCGDAGTTTGERQWGNDQAAYNKNIPNDLGIASVRNSQNVSIVNDGTNTVIAYDSDAGSVNQDTKTRKIYAQKLNSSGKTVWYNGWSASSVNMSSTRRYGTTVLLNDGKVLLAGGDNGSASSSTAEVFNPQAQSMAATGNNMANSREDFAAVLLNDGTALLMSGNNGSNITTASIYNPSTNTFAATTGGLRQGRAGFSAVQLRTGTVLVIGGTDYTNYYTSTELYTPSSGSFAFTGPLTRGSRAYPGAALLPSGEVLIAGGSTASAVPLSTAEKYDPVGATWTTAGNMTTTRTELSLTALPNGKVLAVGGLNAAGNQVSTAELYDPLTNVWTATGSLTTGVRQGHSASLLPNGQVLVVGGFNGSATLSAAEIYDPASGTFSTLTHAASRRNYQQAVSLPDGRTAIIGGEIRATDTNLSSIEFFSIDQQISTANSTNSQNPDLAKDSEGNFQIVWQAWRSEGLNQGATGGSWKVMAQEIDNAASTVTKQYPTGSTNTWSSGGNIPAKRGYTPQVVLSSGKVLLIGGTDGVTSQSTSHLYDPQANTWTTGPNIDAVYGFGTRAALLTTGKVLAVGAGASLNQSSLYDPSTNTWTASGTLGTGRGIFEMVTLNNGKILAAGGTDYSNTRSNAELYDPSTGTWTTTGTMSTSRTDFGLIKLNDGKVLAIGGCSVYGSCGGNTITTVEMYNPDTGTWSAVGGLTTTRRAFNSHLLSNGKVMVYGGFNSVSLSTAEIFDPATQGWSTIATAPSSSYVDVTSNMSVVLSNGKVLTIRNPSAGAQSYIYDPVANTWSTGGSLTTARNTSLTLLKSGKILAAGGYDSGGAYLSSSELYTPDLSEKLVSTDDSDKNFNQTEPKIATDTASAYSYVVWNDDRYTAPSDSTVDKNVYMQKLDGSGNPAWPNGLGENGSYDVRDIRVNNTRGSVDTTVQSMVTTGKTVFNDANTYKPVQLAWTDSRDGSPALSIYGQSYNTMNYSMSSTTWTATFFTNAVSGSNQMDIQVGAMEADGENAYFLSTTGTFAGDNVSGSHTMNFNTLPPSGETSLTHKRLVMKFTHNTGSGIQISYNGSAGVADTKLDVGTVVPERSALLVLIIPALPVLVSRYRRKTRIERKL